jgi:hypothetical protein
MEFSFCTQQMAAMADKTRYMEKTISTLTRATFPVHFTRFFKSTLALGTYPTGLDGTAIVWSTERPTDKPTLPVISLPHLTTHLSPARQLFFSSKPEEQPDQHVMAEFMALQRRADTASAYIDLMEGDELKIHAFARELKHGRLYDPTSPPIFLSGALCLGSPYINDGNRAVEDLQLAAKLAWHPAAAAMIYELILIADKDGENVDLTVHDKWIDANKRSNNADPLSIFQGVAVCFLGSDTSVLAEPFLYAAITNDLSKNPAQDALRASLSFLNSEEIEDEVDQMVHAAYWLSRALQLADADPIMRSHEGTLKAYSKRANVLMREWLEGQDVEDAIMTDVPEVDDEVRRFMIHVIRGHTL